MKFQVYAFYRHGDRTPLATDHGPDSDRTWLSSLPSAAAAGAAEACVRREGAALLPGRGRNTPAWAGQLTARGFEQMRVQGAWLRLNRLYHHSK